MIQNTQNSKFKTSSLEKNQRDWMNKNKFMWFLKKKLKFSQNQESHGQKIVLFCKNNMCMNKYK